MQNILKFGFQYINKCSYIRYLFLCAVMSLVGMVSPLVMGEIINHLAENAGEKVLIQNVIAFGFISVLQQGMSVIQSIMEARLNSDAEYRANRGIIEKLYNASYANICNEDPAMLNQKLSNDIGSVVNFCIAFFRDILINIVFIVCIAVILLSQSLWLWLVIFGLVITYIIVYLIGKRKMYEIGLLYKEAQTSFLGKLYGLIFFMKSIRNNGFVKMSFAKQDDEYKQYYAALYNQLSVNNLFYATVNMISLMAQVLLFLIGGKMVLDGKLGIGFLVAILNYFSGLLQSTDYFLSLGQNYQNTLSSYKRLLPYKDLETMVQGEGRVEKIESIGIQEVSFRYPGQRILFQIKREGLERGKIYWLKGKNGVGKTTFMNVLLGLYGNTYGGNFFLNNTNIRELQWDDFVEKQVAIIEQEPYLLAASLKDNMLCKVKDVDYRKKEQEMYELISAFGMDEFIEKQMQGIDTVYNSMSSVMSGGEKQKIAIIRMLLSDADIWLLDEPTSALDVDSTEFFFKELERRKTEHIILMISHEVPRNYDGIIRLENYAQNNGEK